MLSKEEQHFRFAERAQTDYGVSAVTNWAKENNLGPEVHNLFPVKSEFVLGLRIFSYRAMWTRCCRGGPCISLSGVRSGRMSSQVATINFHFFEKSVLIVKGALWMPLGKLDRALRTDFPVHARPHTFSLPTIYKVLLIRERISIHIDPVMLPVQKLHKIYELDASNSRTDFKQKNLTAHVRMLLCK